MNHFDDERAQSRKVDEIHAAVVGVGASPDTEAFVAALASYDQKHDESSFREINSARATLIALYVAQVEARERAEADVNDIVNDMNRPHAALLNDLVRLREANTRLNRRCQSAEAGLAAKLNPLGARSFGRILANSAATMYHEQLAAVTAERDNLARNGKDVADALKSQRDDARAERDEMVRQQSALSALYGEVTAERDRLRAAIEKFGEDLDGHLSAVGPIPGQNPGEKWREGMDAGVRACRRAAAIVVRRAALAPSQPEGK